MIIKESYLFTKIIQDLMPDDMYAELQVALVRQPELGRIMQGSGGLRKVRWNLSGQGKRGGLRVIYYWIEQNDEIYMIYAYKKSRSENLTSKQLQELRAVVEEELNNG